MYRLPGCRRASAFLTTETLTVKFASSTAVSGQIEAISSDFSTTCPWRSTSTRKTSNGVGASATGSPAATRLPSWGFN